MSTAPARIVLTGAPASGKTECLCRLRTDHRFREFVFFDELARQLLAEEPRYRTDREAFHLEIYRRQTAREDAIASRGFVSDRGTVDAFAFHPETVALVNTTLEREYRRYSMVVHLESTAHLGPEVYRTDEIRDESIADALAIEQAITQVWRPHPGYRYLAVEAEFELKYQRFLDLVLTETQTA